MTDYVKVHPDYQIYILDNFLDDDMCQEGIDLINKLREKHPRSRVLKKITHNGKDIDSIWYRRLYHNQEVADAYWDRLKDRVPEEVKMIGSKEMSAISKRGTAIYYDHGDVLDHYDGKYEYGGFFHQYTLLLYFNDDFDRGGTKFYPDYKEGDDVNKLKNKIYVKPKKGRAVLFNINLRHKGVFVDGEKWGFMYPVFHK